MFPRSVDALIRSRNRDGNRLAEAPSAGVAPHEQEPRLLEGGEVGRPAPECRRNAWLGPDIPFAIASDRQLRITPDTAFDSHPSPPILSRNYAGYGSISPGRCPTLAYQRLKPSQRSWVEGLSTDFCCIQDFEASQLPLLTGLPPLWRISSSLFGSGLSAKTALTPLRNVVCKPSLGMAAPGDNVRVIHESEPNNSLTGDPCLHNSG
jgi:hypothetical protein